MFLHVSVCPQGGAIPVCIVGVIPACLAAGLGGGGWYPSMPCRFRGPNPRGKLRGIWLGGGFQAHTQGEVEGDLAWGGSPGPQPRRKLRGIWPGGSPGPQPRRKLRGIWPGEVSRPTTKGEVEGDLVRRVSRPTTKGKLEEDLAWEGLQAHNQGGS